MLRTVKGLRAYSTCKLAHYSVLDAGRRQDSWARDKEQFIKCVYTHSNSIFSFFFSLGLHLRHMEVPRLGVELELQLPATATATATATWDLSLICDLHHSSWQYWILNPLSEARDQTCIFIWIPVAFVTTEPQWELPR